MVKGIGTLILRTGRLDEVAAFYKALGLPLKKATDSDGTLFFACEFKNQRFAVYEAIEGDSPALNMGGTTLIGLDVHSLEDAYDAAMDLGAKIAVEPEPMPWGRRAVLLDPDGRPVEITQR